MSLGLGKKCLVVRLCFIPFQFLPAEVASLESKSLLFISPCALDVLQRFLQIFNIY